MSKLAEQERARIFRALQGRVKDLQTALDALSKDVAALEQPEATPEPAKRAPVFRRDPLGVLAGAKEHRAPPGWICSNADCACRRPPPAAVPPRCEHCKDTGWQKLFGQRVQCVNRCCGEDCFACEGARTILLKTPCEPEEGLGAYADDLPSDCREVRCNACEGTGNAVPNPLTPHQLCSDARVWCWPSLQCTLAGKKCDWRSPGVSVQVCRLKWSPAWNCRISVKIRAGRRPMEIPPPRPHPPEPGLCSPGLAENGCVDATGAPIKPMVSA
jgi:hypothetical protein